MQAILDIFAVPVEIMSQLIDDYIDESEQEGIEKMRKKLKDAGANDKIANMIANAAHSVSLLNVVWALKDSTGRIERFMQVYYWVGRQWNIDWIRSQIDDSDVGSIWTQISKTEMLSDIDCYQRAIVRNVFKLMKPYRDVNMVMGFDKITKVYTQERSNWMATIQQMQSLTNPDFSVFSVALMKMKKLSDLLNSELAVSQKP